MRFGEYSIEESNFKGFRFGFHTTEKRFYIRAILSDAFHNEISSIEFFDSENEMYERLGEVENILGFEKPEKKNVKENRYPYISDKLKQILIATSKQGCFFSKEKGTFNLSEDAKGKWSIERFNCLKMAILRDLYSDVYGESKAPVIIITPEITSALIMAGVLVYNKEFEYTGLLYPVGYISFNIPVYLYDNKKDVDKTEFYLVGNFEKHWTKEFQDTQLYNFININGNTIEKHDFKKVIVKGW